MAWVATAVIGSAVIGAGASYLGAKKQADAANNASDMTMAQYQQTRGDLMPWQNTGRGANSKLADYLGITPSSGPDWDAYLRANPDVAASATYGGNPAQHYEDYGRKEGRVVPQLSGTPSGSNFGSLLKPYTGDSLTSDPGYQFGIQQGEQGINRLAMSGSGRNNGATMKALLKFNQDYGGTKFNEGFSRDASQKNQMYGFLSGTSALGENAAAHTGALGANAAGTAGQFMTNAGDANAAGMVGVANSANSGVGNYLGYQSNQNMMEYLKGLRAPTGAGSPFAYAYGPK